VVPPVRWLGEVDCNDVAVRDQIVKSQAIRLADVVLVGPLMIYGATKMPRGLPAVVLGLLGVGTIILNGVNYMRFKDANDKCSKGGLL